MLEAHALGGQPFERSGAHNLARLRDLDPPQNPFTLRMRSTGASSSRMGIEKLGRFRQIGYRIDGDRTRRSMGAATITFSSRSTMRAGEHLLIRTRRKCLCFPAAHRSTYKRRGIAIERVVTDNGKVLRRTHFRRFSLDTRFGTFSRRRSPRDETERRSASCVNEARDFDT